MTDLSCPRCNHALPAEALLGAAVGYSRVTDSGASSCPTCGESIEFRIGAGVIELGYTYWAGSLHFEAMSSQSVHDLRAAWADGVLTVTVGARSFILSAAPGTRPS